MSEQTKRLFRGGARAVTGVAIIGVSVAAALALGTGFVPSLGVERGVVSIDVDTSRDAQLALVCTGSFGELGADPSRPTDSIPGGDTALTISGETSQEFALARVTPGGSDPLVLESPITSTLAAAEIQTLGSATQQGIAASACTEPAHEQWVVGGSSALGVSSTLVLGNPFEVPATVQVTLFDETGKIDSNKTAGVLVPAKSQRIVSLNGYAPASESLAVRVESVGAAVSAHMGVSHKVDIRSFAVDTVTSQAAPQSMLVVPGVTNRNTHNDGPTGDLQEHEDFPVVVRVLSPAASGSAQITAYFEDREAETLGSIDFAAGVVTDFTVNQWPEDAQGVVVSASAPIIGGVQGSADVPPAHDYAWFAPAPVLAATTEVGVSVVSGGELVIANTSDADARVAVTPEAGSLRAVTVEVPAGNAVPVSGVSGAATLRSDVPVSAGVRVVQDAFIAGYPVIAPPERSSTLRVYTR